MVTGFWLGLVLLVVLISNCLCCYSGLFSWLKSRLWGPRRAAAGARERGDLLPLARPRAQAMSRVQTIARLRAMTPYPPPPPPQLLYDVRMDRTPSDPPPPYSFLDPIGSGAAPLLSSSEEAPPEEVALVPSDTLPSGRLSCSSRETTV